MGRRLRRGDGDAVISDRTCVKLRNGSAAMASSAASLSSLSTLIDRAIKHSNYHWRSERYKETQNAVLGAAGVVSTGWMLIRSSSILFAEISETRSRI